ncbi:hypothetical protein SAMN05444285_102243 [Draconibacterium orientale]|uniref:Uncharacterized protein n=1 Tax=Draconibacterium orientale TaxID=1168034 RepID=X5DKT5_9BACT|nr:hypothetical protein [Draconibacterium orientale]AHW61779.1 hypothetical protein FH5T_08200 [Draconibacterium orientale]SES84253.1 hypothetical protein SAMN05444285_102243 [Draconibacterium orientale]
MKKIKYQLLIVPILVLIILAGIRRCTENNTEKRINEILSHKELINEVLEGDSKPLKPSSKTIDQIWEENSNHDFERDTKVGDKITLEETIIRYDNELGVIQKSYRLWLERSSAQFEALLDFNTFKSLDKINTCVSFSMACQDTIRNNVFVLGTKLTEYGNKLKEFIPNQSERNNFEVNWLETKEDILKTMAYDMETTNIYLKLFRFVQKQYSKYEIVDNTILFENESLLEEYYSILDEVDMVTEITIKQTDLRVKVFEEYTQLVNSVKTTK